MRKKIYRTLDIIWRVIGGLILILFIYGVIQFSKGKEIESLGLVITISLIFYAIISIIVFLPPMLIKFFKKVKRKTNKK